MAEVHVLPGRGPIASAIGAPPVETIVARLEELLALARAGEVRALAYAFVDARNNTFDSWVTAPNEPTGHLLVACVTYLHHELVAAKCAGGSVAPLVPPTEPA